MWTQPPLVKDPDSTFDVFFVAFCPTFVPFWSKKKTYSRARALFLSVWHSAYSSVDEALVIVKSDFISDLIPPVFVAKLWRFIDSATRGSGLNL